MAFTELQRVKIRRYLGAPAVYLTDEPLLENAMNAVELKPESEAEAIALLATLDALDAKLADVGCLKTVQVGNIQMDAIRAQAYVRQVARTYAGRLAVLFALNGPIRDAFGIQPVGDVSMPMQMDGRRAF
jgi:hypothetical protein